MKVTRFNAATKDLLAKDKIAIRYQLINNTIKSSQLDIESKLIEIDERKNQVIRDLATADNSLIKINIQLFAELIQKEENLKDAIKLSKKVLDVLDEEIEVEEN